MKKLLQMTSGIAFMFLLNISVSLAQTTILSENFNLFVGGSIGAPGSTDRSGALDSWMQTPGYTGSKIYEAGGAIKFGTASLAGYLVTPTINLSGASGAATITFYAQQYSAGADGATIQIFHAPDGTTFAQLGSNITITGTMTQYTVELPSGGTVNSKIKIGTSVKRAYLEDFLITQVGAVPDPEPTEHVTAFTASTSDFKSITLTWTGSAGAQVPAKYLILAKKGAGTYASVADLTAVADDNDWADNNAAINVLHSAGANSYTFTGLTGETVYDFVIYPYTNSGVLINFKTDGTVPSTQKETTAQPVSYSGFDTDLGTWTAVNIASNKDWAYLLGTANANNFGADVAGDDWLISPSFDLTNYNNPTFSFNSWTQFTDVTLGLEVKITTAYTGDVSTTTWTTLSPTLPAANSATWIPSGNIDLTPYSGSAVRIAFHYTASGVISNTCASWKIDDVLIDGDRKSTWTGAIDNDLSNPGNWSNGLPTKFVDAIIGGVTTISSGTFNCNNMTIDINGTLTSEVAATLNITGSLILKSNGVSKPAAAMSSFISLGPLSYASASMELALPIAARWYYFSIPVTTALASTVCNVATEELYEYNTAGSAWVKITDGATVLSPAKGYAVRLLAPKVITFTGTFNSGLVAPPAISNTGNNWWLVGNCYPSSEDFGEDITPVAGWTLTDIRTTTYVRTDGAFDVYNYVGGTAINGGSKYIPPMQAYWVKVTGASPVFQTVNTVRVHSSKPFVKNELTKTELRFNVSRDIYRDEALIVFNEKADQGFELYDAEKFFITNNTTPQLYTMAGDIKLVINGLKSLQEGLSVNLGFKTPVSGEFTFSASEMESLEGYNAYLYDHLTSKYVNLNQNPTYTFTSDVTDATNRLAVYFFRSLTENEISDYFAGLGVDQAGKEKITVYGVASQIYVNTTASRGQIKVYDMTGREITSTVISSNLSKITMNQTGCYLVKVITANETITRKVYIR